MKNISKNLLLISSAFIILFFNTKMIHAAEIGPLKNTIEVSGKATIKVKPNVAYLNANVKTENKDAKKAQEENAQIIDKIKKDIMAKYKLLGEDINTLNYNLSPSYDYVEGKQIFRTYVVEHTLEIKMEKVEKVGEVADTLVESGATSVNNIRFGIKDESEAYNTALQKAVQNARQKSNAITAMLGVKNAKPIAITEQSESMGVIQENALMMQDASPSLKGTTIQQSDIEVIARVQVTLQW